ncbi:MAG: 6-pyruvoyltetrahydropterin/6-carboxytetrahydropterin synthase [Candidatus Sumerlaeota bacterium]|nr:6-pyruvoyltetrahydropterin/6-carboxytetrahydropterin synthase [Candidatus Sumerlaeota bacterium]
MEKIIVHARFHTGHRQIGYPGKCRFVHGHTWRGTITVETDEFPRDELDMSLDFGDLKRILRDLDHKMLVVPDDKEFIDAELFEPEGVVILEGKGPSVENVASYAWNKVVETICGKYPGLGKTYHVEVQIQETENNFFIIAKDTVV